jgi:hypothetical protein
MKTVHCEIQGLSPLLMHRFSEQDRAQIESRSSHATARRSPEEAAESAAYRLPSNGAPGSLYIPAENLLAAIRRAAALRKIGRRSAVAAVCAGVFIEPDRLDLGTCRYEVDARAVVIAATKGRVMRYRPRLNSWKLQFILLYDEDLIPSEELIHDIVADTGTKIGLGDFRPERRGPFGRFAVISWKS